MEPNDTFSLDGPRLDAALEELRDMGYEVNWTDDGCMVAAAGETWRGVGSSRSSALSEALTGMLPSRAARRAFELGVDRRLGVRGAAEPVGTPTPSTPIRRVASTAGPAPVIRITREERAARQRTAAEAAEAAAIPSRVPVTVEDALADLGCVRSRIEDAIGEVALMAPALQRMHVLAWISRARSLEEQFPADRMVQHTTQNIARRLTHLCKIWWPGTVRALQLHTSVDQAARSVEPAPRPMPRRWSELAEVLESRLDAAVNQVSFDDGWLDGPALVPPPSDRVAMFARIRVAIERVAGSLTHTPPDRSDSVKISDEDLAELVEAARRLRWMRGSAPDPELWGAAIGRLRFLVTGLGERGLVLRQTLDPAFRPKGAWQDVVQRSRRGEILAARPAPSERDAFAAWLTTAFEELTTRELVTALSEHSAEVLALGEDLFPESDKRARKRYLDLRAALAGTSEDAAAVAPPPSPVDPDNVSDRLLSQIRTRLPQQRVLFVSNREDAELLGRLRDALGVELSWCISDPRSVDEAVRALQRGSHDLVLSAVAFQDHTTDIMLARSSAAASPRVRYVRVNRARLGAVTRALARELGIT
jgi:hypothetical protein